MQQTPLQISQRNDKFLFPDDRFIEVRQNYLNYLNLMTISILMHFKRDRAIRKQIASNLVSPNYQPLPQATVRSLEAKAHEQISLNKIVSREMDYSKIELFLLLSSNYQRGAFYIKIRQDLAALFRDNHAQRTFQNKWTHSLKSNVMALFNRLAKDFLYAGSDDRIRTELMSLYVEMTDKLLTHEKMSRIQEKFLQPLLIQCAKLTISPETILGRSNYERLKKSATALSKGLSQRETPKTVTSNQFLKFCAMRALEVQLPHEKYLHSQLLHAPNPKYLFPFRTKGTFLALTDELLRKSNRLDLVGCQFWSYYEYEEGDLYERIRRAAEWGGKVDILLMLIRPKIVSGLEKCLNAINEKVFYFSTKHITEEGLNSLMALAETGLNICKNHSAAEPFFSTALERVDIGQLFQHNLLMKEPRLRPFVISLLELYFLLLDYCQKKNLKMKFIPHLALQTTRLLDCQNDPKFTQEFVSVILKAAVGFKVEERAQFLFGIVDTATHDWESKQSLLLGHEIAPISIHAVRLLADFTSSFGFSDEGRAEFKVLKLEFFYVLALNYRESQYFESKQRLSRTDLDISISLANNAIFSILETRKFCRDTMRSHLSTLFGDQIGKLSKPEHQGLLAVIDEVVAYRIQETKTLAYERNTLPSFYALLVNFLQQVERLDPQGKLLKLVWQYFMKCKKAYLLEVQNLKSKDEGRTEARRLITRDASYLVQGCVSANPTLSEFCWTFLQEYIRRVPQMAIYTKVLVVWADCLSILYRKSNQQYQSRSERLRGRYLTSGSPIPTERKEILARMTILMRGLYNVVLRGHVIDSEYLGVRVQYLIRQHCKSASFGFGWKFLKHLITSFKEDRQFIAQEVLTNNSCSWFVNEEYFNKQIDKMKPEKILLDKYLYPLHLQNEYLNKDDFRRIFLAVEPQVQNQFLTVPPLQSQNLLPALLKQMVDLCEKIQMAEERIAELDEKNPEEEQALEELYSQLFDVISRVKMIHLNKENQAPVFGLLLDVTRRFSNYRLLQHILLKIVPFFYCIHQYNVKIVDTLAELLHFVVLELNISCIRGDDQYGDEKNRTQANTFDARLNQFAVLTEYERKEPKLINNRHKVLSCHNRKIQNLQLMYGELTKFFGEYIHVCIAKGFPLSTLLRIISVSFLLEKNILTHLSLQSVCRCLLSQLELVNVLKSALEKGQTAFDEAVIDNFYIKTLKSALFHFQKLDFAYDQLIAASFHRKHLKQRIGFLIKICDYLRNDDFHQLSNKKLPKRHELFARKRQDAPSISRLDISSLRRNTSNRLKGFRSQSMRPVSSYPDTSVNLTILRYSLLYMISEQIDRIKAHSYPLLSEVPNPYSLAGKKGYISNSSLEQLLSFLTAGKGSKLVYNILTLFGDRVQNPESMLKQLQNILSVRPFYKYPAFLPLFAQKYKEDPQKLRQLNYWKPPHIPVLLQYLAPEYENYPALQRYVTKVLAQLEADQILFYLPQIFQGITLASGKIIYHFLLEYARKSNCFAHQLIWLAKVEGRQEQDPHNKSKRSVDVEQHLVKLGKAAQKLIKGTKAQFNRQERNFFHEVDDFYEQVTAISGKMKPNMPSADKKDIIRQEVQKIKVPKSAYLPFNTNYQVARINEESGTPMQSAAKCPFLLVFKCRKYEGPDTYFANKRSARLQTRFTDDPQDDLPQEESIKPMNSMDVHGSKIKIPSASSKGSRSDNQIENPSSLSDPNIKKAEEKQIACIFKVFDDIRQDSLALQVIRLFLEVFERHGLDLKLFPYRTLSNRTGTELDIGGIIEVVPNCVSRDSIGKTNQQSLYEFFINNFGAEHHAIFQTARQNFIRSQAAYSLISYIIQVKDRHNGNILIDKEQGYLVHIDFGFILETSPAGNMKFQRAAFKLTDEMIRIMGGSTDSEPFQLYLTLVIKGFLLARRYHRHIENMVKLMARSGLPCFLPKALQNLHNRFFLELSQIEAAEEMKDLVLKAADHWTTNWYDRIQWMQQKIYH